MTLLSESVPDCRAGLFDEECLLLFQLSLSVTFYCVEGGIGIRFNIRYEGMNCLYRSLPKLLSS
jgi:hypothetical protein